MANLLCGPEKLLITKAVNWLQKGKIIVIPTDTVYGIAVDAASKKGVKEIFRLKKRPEEKPLILLFGNEKMLFKLCALSQFQKEFIEKYMPGAVTAIIPKPDWVNDEVSAGLKTIGVRIPEHTVAREIISVYGRPLAVPSANPSGLKPPVNAMEVYNYFKDENILIIDGGESPQKKPSTIADITGDGVRILREGPVKINV